MNKLVILIVSFLLSSTITLQGQWAKTYGGSGNEWLYGIQQTQDGGYILTGDTTSFRGPDFYLIKLNSQGEIQWNRAFNDIYSFWDRPRALKETEDGGFIVAGLSGGTQFGSFKVLVLRLDAAGNLIWSKAYDAANNDTCYAIEQTGDGGFVLAGASNSFGLGDNDIWVLKIFANGDIGWQYRYGGPGQDLAYSVSQTNDGGYILTGESIREGTNFSDAILLKLDSSGNMEWQKFIGGEWGDIGRRVLQTPDGGYVLLADTDSFFNPGPPNILLVKTNSTGTIEWGNVYGGYHLEYASSLSIVDQGYIFAGWSHSFSSNRENDIWAVRTNTNGNILWQKAYGGDGGEGGGHISKTRDGGFILGGYSITYGKPENGGAGEEDFLILKVDSEGQICTPCPLIKDTNATPVSATVSASPGTLERNPTNVIPYSPNISQYDPLTMSNTLCFKPNAAPVANAGVDQEVAAGPICEATVSLDGSASYDGDGDSLVYSWTLNGTIFQGVNPTITLPLGTHVFSLVVNDGTVDSEPDFVTITVVDKTPPQPDLATLRTVRGECSAQIAAAPTATDNCLGKITGTTNDPTTYNSQGTYAVTWTYDDGHGNIVIQTQTVVVEDVTPPTIKAAGAVCVPWGKGKGSQANKIVLSATDNCPDSTVTLTIDKVEIFNNGGNLVNGNGILEIDRVNNIVYVKPNGTGWTVKITATAADNKGNTATTTPPITVSLIKC
jgi:hypothetical protein